MDWLLLSAGWKEMKWFTVKVDDFISGNVLLDFCHVLKCVLGCV